MGQLSIGVFNAKVKVKLFLPSPFCSGLLCSSPGVLIIVDLCLKGQESHLYFPVRHQVAGPGLPVGWGQGQSPSSPSCSWELRPADLLSWRLPDSAAGGGAGTIGSRFYSTRHQEFLCNCPPLWHFVLEKENEMLQRRVRGTER